MILAKERVGFMKKIYLIILCIILATFSLTVHAEQEAEKFFDAVVEIRISVPQNARTAGRFGSTNAVQGVRVVARREFTGPWEYLLQDAIFTDPPIERFSGAALIDRKRYWQPVHKEKQTSVEL